MIQKFETRCFLMIHLLQLLIKSANPKHPITVALKKDFLKNIQACWKANGSQSACHEKKKGAAEASATSCCYFCARQGTLIMFTDNKQELVTVLESLENKTKKFT